MDSIPSINILGTGRNVLDTIYSIPLEQKKCIRDRTAGSLGAGRNELHIWRGQR